ncbi:Zinc finger protein 529 [Plakobranchus ocellatus]|uniref:Zinc finger protein 529 n=1 Tax=Plakobranchus ocellatus TaxID=259542 RepID=A0AAV4BJT2_9GAST|nr:Zinc finger protein 529 [Plakobranchus ocellatus]
MTSLGEDMTDDSSDLTPAELEMVAANEHAGLVAQLACHFCGLEFDVKKTRTLRAHIEEVHILGDSGYMCGMCCEEFASRKAVETHMSTFHRTPKPLGCGLCGETFRIKTMLLKHLDSHTQPEHDNNTVGLCYCGECFEFFDSVSSLHAHTAVHREQAVFVCGACGLQSQHRHIMVKHLECHVISNLLAAEGNTAEASFESLPMAQIDASQVQVSTPVLQEDEEGETESMEGLREEPMSTGEETSYKCGICSASFSNLPEAVGHAETHQEEEFNLLLEDSTGNTETVGDGSVSMEASVTEDNEKIDPQTLVPDSVNI